MPEQLMPDWLPLLHLYNWRFPFRFLPLHEDMRKKYLSEEDVLLEENLASKNPFVLFKNWFETASVAQANYETNAVCLATADK